MKFILNALKELPEYRELQKAVDTGKTRARVKGVTDIHKATLSDALQKS